MTDRPLSTRDLAGAEVHRRDEQGDQGERYHADRDGQEPETQDQPSLGAPATTEGPFDRPADQGLGNGSQAGEEEPTSATGADDVPEPLLPPDQTERFTARWEEIQRTFVDQPRQSVEQADALVADLMQRLAASFSNERDELEAQWDTDGNISTEDLRVALTRYRSFFERLLAA